MAEKQPSVTRKILQWGCLIPMVLALVGGVSWVVRSRQVLQRAERGHAAMHVGMSVAEAIKAASDSDGVFAESQPDAQGNRASFGVMPDKKEGGFQLLRPEPIRRVTPEELADMVKKDGRTWTATFHYSGTPGHEFSATLSPQGLVQSVSPLQVHD